MAGIAIGAKLRDLRIKNGLTQAEVADRCELSKGFISQLEGDQTSPSIATLIDILDCLGTNINDFFNVAPEERIVFGEDDWFTKESDDLSSTITWIVPNSQKNDMEPIILSLLPGGRSSLDEPHSGEEFGYVLSGAVTVHIGDKKYKAKKGECFYFSPDRDHYIENNHSAAAKVLWVAAPPSF